MRPIWNGHISFGLVQVPIAIYPAEQRTDLQLHMIDSRDHARVRYERVNAATGEEVPWDQVVKAYEYDKGSYVEIDEETLDRVAPEATKAVEIEAFVDIDEIDPIYFDKPYYLEPGKKGEKGYVLLRETMRETRRAAIARIVIRTRQYIAAMVPRGDALTLHLLRYHQEIRPLSDLDLPGGAEEVGVTKAELKMARTLIESMESEWRPDERRDERRENLLRWIEQRIESGDVERAPDAPEPAAAETTSGADLMETLRRSVRHKGSPSGRTRPARKKAPRAGTKRKSPSGKKSSSSRR